MNFVNCYEDANRSEPYPWVNETKIAPWVIYVLRRATSGIDPAPFSMIL
jgi:hypothetical protein